MYFKYSWNANATLAQVTADIVAVICSANPDSSILSAGCDKPFSTLLANTSVSNWTVHDAAAAANSQVLKSLNLDGTTYKYLQLTITANSISILGWESWNASTHVGTNGTASGGSVTIPNIISGFAFTAAGNLSIIANPRNLIIINSPLLSTANIFLLEFSRESVLLDNTYPCIITGYQASRLMRSNYLDTALLSTCRIKNPNGAGDLVGATMGNAIGLNNIIGFNSVTFSQASGVTGIDGQNHFLTMPIQLGYVSTSYSNVTNLGTVQGGLLLIPTHSLVYNSLDEIVINNITYIMIPQTTSSSTLLIPKA